MSNDYIIFKCPHCSLYIEVNKTQVNCGIFRHAIYKQTHANVNPHLSKDQCDLLVMRNEVYGCCKPFQLIRQGQTGSDGNNFIVSICDYI